MITNIEHFRPDLRRDGDRPLAEALRAFNNSEPISGSERARVVLAEREPDVRPLLEAILRPPLSDAAQKVAASLAPRLRPGGAGLGDHASIIAAEVATARAAGDQALASELEAQGGRVLDAARAAHEQASAPGPIDAMNMDRYEWGAYVANGFRR